MKRDAPDSSWSFADLAALGQLFEEHRPRLLAMIERRIDPALAARVAPEEILNEAFLQARRQWPRFKSQSSLSPYAWLHRAARDCLIEAWRRETRARRDLRAEMPWPEASSVQLIAGLVHSGTSPSAAVARGELQQQMRDVLAMLKEKDRDILWMRHYDQLSYAEAAQVLGTTENAATVRYVRALRRLKDLWQALHPDQGFVG
jgi:RNA polymerase sigma-70 factor (ECF subfamily)